MVAQERQDGHACLPQRESQLVECGPRGRGGPPQDEVADNRQKVGALGDNLVDQLAPCLGIRLAPDLETRGGLQVTDNGEPPALDVDRPAVELPWWRQTGPSEALLHTAAHRAKESQALTQGSLGTCGHLHLIHVGFQGNGCECYA